MNVQEKLPTCITVTLFHNRSGLYQPVEANNIWKGLLQEKPHFSLENAILLFLRKQEIIRYIFRLVKCLF